MSQSWPLRLIVAAVLIGALSLLIGCGDGNGDGSGTTDGGQTPGANGTPGPTETPLSGEESEVNEAVQEVFLSVRLRSSDRLRELLGPSLRDSVTGQELEEAIACVPRSAGLDIARRAFQLSGDTATATITFSVTEGDQATEVDRIWQFERDDDGTWKLSALPECPLG
jgi:hypothetical protein